MLRLLYSAFWKRHDDGVCPEHSAKPLVPQGPFVLGIRSIVCFESTFPNDTTAITHFNFERPLWGVFQAVDADPDSAE